MDPISREDLQNYRSWRNKTTKIQTESLPKSSVTQIRWLRVQESKVNLLTMEKEKLSQQLMGSYLLNTSYSLLTS